MNGSEHTAFRGTFASGNNGGGTTCKNDATCANVPNRGPIPPGLWVWDGGSMKSATSTLIFAALVNFSSVAASADAPTVRIAELAIGADILLEGAEATKSRCATTPCPGPRQSEVGLALLAANKSAAGTRALARLIRYRLDGGLSEDYTCAVLERQSTMRRELRALNPKDLTRVCESDFHELTRSHSKFFSVSDRGVLCRSVEAIDAARSELLEALLARRKCGKE